MITLVWYCFYLDAVGMWWKNMMKESAFEKNPSQPVSGIKIVCINISSFGVFYHFQVHVWLDSTNTILHILHASILPLFYLSCIPLLKLVLGPHQPKKVLHRHVKFFWYDQHDQTGCRKRTRTAYCLLNMSSQTWLSTQQVVVCVVFCWFTFVFGKILNSCLFASCACPGS